MHRRRFIAAALLSPAAGAQNTPPSPADLAADLVWRKLDTVTFRGKQDDIFFIDPLRGWYVNSGGRNLRTRDPDLNRPERFHWHDSRHEARRWAPRFYLWRHHRRFGEVECAAADRGRRQELNPNGHETARQHGACAEGGAGIRRRCDWGGSEEEPDRGGTAA